MPDGDNKSDIGEFMTSWAGFARPGLQAWSDRRRDQLIGTVKSSHYLPKFRLFDLLRLPNEQVPFLENEDHRIGVEAVVGAQERFHRYIDTDMIYFQYCGNTSIETEFGVYDMAPGELMLIPAGIAHRSTGTVDSLRVFCRAYEPIGHVREEELYTSHTEFEMTRTGGLDWSIPKGAKTPGTGQVIEEMHCWHDGPEDYTIAERDYDYLVGASSLRPGAKESGIRKIRAFDFFEGISGKSGSGGGEPFALMESKCLRVRVYNIVGEQFAFHRALRSEEVRIQFRGDAIELCEYESDPISPGEVTVVPRGIAHSVITDPPEDKSFLRLNFYSVLPWQTPTDLTKHNCNSTFDLKTNVIKEAEWRLGEAAE